MVREALPSDLAGVVRLAKGAAPWIVRITPAYLVRELAKPGATLYVEDAAAGALRGFMLVTKHQTGLMVELIATDPNLRRQGIAASLLETVKGPAFTWIHPANKPSLKLFKSLGWKESDPPKRHEDKVYCTLPAPERDIPLAV